MEAISAEEARRMIDAAERGTLPDPEAWPAITDAITDAIVAPIVEADDAGSDIARLGPLLDQAVEASPESPGPFIARGAMFRSLGWTAAAVDELAYACELAPLDDPKVWLRLAAVEEERGRWDEVANAIDEALEHGADDPELFALLGEAHRNAGDAPRAIAAFEEGLDAQPEDPRLRLGRARTSLDLALYEDAIEDCVAVEATPDHPADVYRIHARALIGRGDDTGAAEMLDRSIAAAPDDAESYRLRGDLASSTGDIALAAENYRRAQAIEADDETEVALAECLIELGDADAALDLAQALLQRVTATQGADRTLDQPDFDEPPAVDEFDARLVVARALRGLGRESEALESIHRAIEIDPEAPEPYLERSEIHAAAGRSNLAWRDARWAIDRDPEAIDAYVLRGRLALEIESAAEALGDLEAALELDPEHGPARTWRGRAFALAGDERAAAAEWEAAERILPSAHPLRDAIARWRAET